MKISQVIHENMGPGMEKPYQKLTAGGPETSPQNEKRKIIFEAKP